MTNTKIDYPENLAYAVGMIIDHIDEVVTGASDEGDKDGDDAIDTETINQILVQTGFPAIT